MRYRADFVAIGQPVTEIWRLPDFSKMAAVRHLGFAVRVFGPPTVIKTIKCALWVTKHTHHKSKVEYCV